MKPKQRSCAAMVPIALAAVIVLLGASCVQSQNRIVNGQEAEKGEFPFMVALYERDEPEDKFICGGSILDERHILTAAHCMARPQSAFAKVGCHRRSKCSAPELTIEEFISHPNYTGQNNDLAIIRTNEEIEFTEFGGLGSVGKIRFPYSVVDDYFDYDTLTVAGWGLAASNAHEAEDVLMKANMQARPQAQCDMATTKHICTRGLNVNACMGDSGGPLVRYLPNGSMSLVGVVQGSGSGIGMSDICSPEQGTLFVRVAAYAKWIRDCMAATTFESASCSSPDS